MDDEAGKQMGKAIRAVLEMQADCIKLFHDMDKELEDYVHVLGNVVALDLGSAISRRAYLAQNMHRLYVQKGDADRMLGVNICFYDLTNKELVEPTLVIANIEYSTGSSGPQENLKRGWDPWNLYFTWSAPAQREPSKAISIGQVPKRPIDKAIVAAAPLYSINSLAAAMELVDIVGRPKFSGITSNR